MWYHSFVVEGVDVPSLFEFVEKASLYLIQ